MADAGRAGQGGICAVSYDALSRIQVSSPQTCSQAGVIDRRLWLSSTLEIALDKHNSHPALSSTYNPAVLARAPSLASDISFLLDVPESLWQTHPIHKALQEAPPQELSDYVSRIQYFADSAPDPSPLLAHAYVRYLGDLSGGQVIRRRIEKAYGIERDDGRGTRFYDFKQLGGTKSGNIGDMRKIKEWFRDGMNQGGGDDQERKSQYPESNFPGRGYF